MRLDSTTLLYLGVAEALLLLRDVKSLAFGDYKVEFDRVRKIAKEAENKAENAGSVLICVADNAKAVLYAPSDSYHYKSGCVMTQDGSYSVVRLLLMP